MYDRNPQTRIPLLQAMVDACGDMAVDAFHGWIRHARRHFPAAWPGKTLLVMWMGCCGQTETEEKMQHSFFFFFFYCNCIQ